VKATEVTAGLAESNGSLLPGIWRDSLPVTCGLTACTPGSAPGPTLGNEYGKTLPLPFYITLFYCVIHLRYLFKYLAAHINRTPPAITPSATPTVTTAIIPAVNTHPQHLHVHWRRQLWGTGARAPASTSNNLSLLLRFCDSNLLCRITSGFVYY